MQFTKVFDLQNKMNYGSFRNIDEECYENPIVHIENIKNLNERVFDLSEENNCLKQELQNLQNQIKFGNKHNFVVNSNNNPIAGAASTQMNTLEVNNGNHIYMIFV